MQLEQNPTKNQAELDSKKKQLAELQSKEKSVSMVGDGISDAPALTHAAVCCR